jgi:hypothetical protein
MVDMCGKEYLLSVGDVNQKSHKKESYKHIKIASSAHYFRDDRTIKLNFLAISSLKCSRRFSRKAKTKKIAVQYEKNKLN